ncbi:MAG: endo-1,4-beta-xylanase [Lachnospiraceae bacterium]|nr:endo-1,4-beta-xylanase [Lachnospiraceae bacterium]
MKKIICYLLAGAMIISLAACGKNVDQVSSEDEAQAVISASEDSTEVSTETENDENVAEVEEDITAQEEILRIKELFAQHGLKAGTCLSTQMIDNDDYNALILDQFNSITMENSMKPDYLFNKQDSIASGDLVVEFNQDMIKMLNWAKTNNMAVRGHTLVWHSQTPDWIFYKDFDTKNGLVTREEMLARLDSYIRQVFEGLEEKGYIDLFYAYDVVNEAWMEDGTMRDSKWKEIIGDDYLWQAFNIANKYAPESIDLYYNDYNEQFKTETLVDFVETLKDEDGNYLIDGVGFQAHLYTSDNLKDYFRTVDAVAKLGVKVQLTELDVCLGAYKKPLFAVEENTKAQGQFMYDLIYGLLERVDNGTLNMDAITFWGFADDLSWRKEYSPLLYNKKLEPKFAYYGAMQIKEKAGY